jgi:hypothetical protein
MLIGINIECVRNEIEGSIVKDWNADGDQRKFPTGSKNMDGYLP